MHLQYVDELKGFQLKAIGGIDQKQHLTPDQLDIACGDLLGCFLSLEKAKAKLGMVSATDSLTSTEDVPSHQIGYLRQIQHRRHVLPTPRTEGFRVLGF